MTKLAEDRGVFSFMVTLYLRSGATLSPGSGAGMTADLAGFWHLPASLVTLAACLRYTNGMNPTLSLTTQLVETVHWLAARGWSPATGGNFSVRKDADSAWISASGKDKSVLRESDLLTVNLQGEVLSASIGDKPSAETLLHTRLYALDATIGAVLHTHSVAATVLSRLVQADRWVIRGYEMQKALQGNSSHEENLTLWVVDNTQDMPLLADQLAQRWQQSPLRWGFLVRGHGLYAWGRDLAEARRHVEGIEFLLACDLEMRRLGL